MSDELEARLDAITRGREAEIEKVWKPMAAQHAEMVALLAQLRPAFMAGVHHMGEVVDAADALLARIRGDA